MKFIISRASNFEYKEDKEFNSLKDLIEWIDKIDEDIILYSKERKIKIYDDYIE